ncbi:MAG: hypothetical protein RL367_2563 [Pseudomonadota bacterium]|jgi:UrcA family protein
MNRKTTLLATLAALKLTGIAHATPVEPTSQAVRLGDLNLSSEAGHARATMRITHAARSVCGGGYDRDLQAQAAFNSCYDQARSTAIAALRTLSPTVEVAAR